MTGDPGVGKSALAAHLTHFGRDKVIAAQFVEWDKPEVGGDSMATNTSSISFKERNTSTESCRTPPK